MPQSLNLALIINIDNKARFGYLDSYGFRLIDASIYWAVADADPLFSIFGLSALKWIKNQAGSWPL